MGRSERLFLINHVAKVGRYCGPMNDSEPFQRATSAAHSFLSYRARSEAEVKTRLLRRFPLDVVNLVLENLTRQGLIDDSEFALLWKQSRDTHRPRSAFLIRRELLAKGVEEELASQAVANVDDTDAAYRAGQKFTRRLYDVDFQKFSARLGGHLRRRGFSGSVSRAAVTRLWSEFDRQEGESANSHTTYPHNPDRSGGFYHA